MVKDSPGRKSSERLLAGKKSTVISVSVNALLATIKIIAGILGHTYALIADGIESLMDVFSSIVVWSGLQIAARPPDENHPYGHGKAESLAGIVVALGLLAAAVGIAVQSIREILNPSYSPAPFTLLVLIGVIVTKELLFRFVLKVGESIESTAVKVDAWHHRSDAITSLAAFIGISIALIGGKGYESADDWFALLACLVIAYNGIRLFRSAVSEVMDEAPPAEIETRIRDVSAAVPGVKEVEKCLIRKSGYGYFVDIHVVVDGKIQVREGHLIGHNVKDAIQASGLNIFDVLVHVEPDVLMPL